MQAMPLADHKIIETRNDEAAEAILSRALVPLHFSRISNRGAFGLEMSGLRLKHLFFGYNRFTTDTVVEPGVIEDAIIFGIAEDHKRPSYFDIDETRATASPETITIMSPTRNVRIKRGAGSGMFGAVISSGSLAERFRDVTGRSCPQAIVMDPATTAAEGPGRAFRETLRATNTALEQMGAGARNAIHLALMEDSLLSAALALPGNHCGLLSEHQPPDIAPWIVRRAEDYMVAHLGEAITLSHLIKVCGCSRSSLTLAFQQSRGYSAMAFLQQRRIEHARERLRREPGSSVTQIALDCGFGNHGRFAQAYQKLFGELPSETRRRHFGPGGESTGRESTGRESAGHGDARRESSKHEAPKPGQLRPR